MREILLSGLGMFLCAYLLHLALWKIIKPKADLTPLLKLFVSVPFFVIPGLLYAGFDFTIPAGAILILLYLAFAAAYIQTYPGIASDIPSFQILLALEEFPKTPQELMKFIPQDSLMESRVTKMLEDGFVTRDDAGQLRLQGKGRLLADVFFWYRWLLGRPEGKG